MQQATECHSKYHIILCNTVHSPGVCEGHAIGTVTSPHHPLRLVIGVAPLTIDELLVLICLYWLHTLFIIRASVSFRTLAVFTPLCRVDGAKLDKFFGLSKLD